MGSRKCGRLVMIGKCETPKRHENGRHLEEGVKSVPAAEPKQCLIRVSV